MQLSCSESFRSFWSLALTLVSLCPLVENIEGATKSGSQATSTIGTQTGTQGASQSASQAGGNVIRSQAADIVSPMRRTKKSASRPTPTK
uniref:Uncharacterized protein n=1 Tax=Tanacetum cinerariifolium TaxID=118510 RepID=A0A699GWU9_TANCI|nr:hypothetical protein [Tanacetum cinerariifolium]